MSNVEQGIMNVEGTEQIYFFLVPAYRHGKQAKSTGTAEKNKNDTS